MLHAIIVGSGSWCLWVKDNAHLNIILFLVKNKFQLPHFRITTSPKNNETKELLTRCLMIIFTQMSSILNNFENLN